MAKRNINNKIVILQLFQEHGPCTVAELIPIAIKAGVNLKEDSFSPCITQWYHLAKDGWQYLHRIRVPNSIAYMYEFDGAVERKPKPRVNSPKKGPGKSLARIDSKAPVRPAKPATPASRPEVYAKVLNDEPDLMVMLTQDRRVVVGAIYVPSGTVTQS